MKERVRRKRDTGQKGRRDGREETPTTGRTNGSVGQTARIEAEKWHGRGGHVGSTARDKTVKLYGREGNVERLARDGTRSRNSTGARR